MYNRHARLMGSAFGFQVEAHSISEGEHLLDLCVAEVRRIENVLTEFQPDSETSRINRAAGSGEWIEVSPEVFSLLERCKRLSATTQGAFDITGVALRSLYSFKGGSFTFPTPAHIQQRLRLVGYPYIEMQHPAKVRLAKPGMHLAFGAIGKGYAADKVRQLMQRRGCLSGAINASGDLCVWGQRPDDTPWKIGIAHPDKKGEMLFWLTLNNSAIATSGDYEQYFEHNGKRYSHNLDPKTGLPVSGIKSVSVISPGAELSDALATAVFVLGVDFGIDLLNQLPETHGLVVTDKNQTFTTKNLHLLPQITG